MIIKDKKFDFDDLLIVPKASSKISHRDSVNLHDENGMLPLFAAPMDTVIEYKNYKLFRNNKIYPIIPRTSVEAVNNEWKAIGLSDFKAIAKYGNPYVTNYILLDIANGHMHELLKLIKSVKSDTDLILMVGNVAKPETYGLLSDAGVDYVRVGIGNGGGCLTTQQTGVGYPMASLISECYELSCKLKTPAKIVADGGMKNYSDIIKALALGADYVMLGSILNRALESAGHTYRANIKHQGAETWTEPGEIVNQYDEDVKIAFQNGAKFYKKFRGMSTKGAQRAMGSSQLKTSEGVTRMNPVEYTLEGWVENFRHYFSTAMSYTGSSNLTEFIGNVELIQITQSSFNRFNTYACHPIFF